MLGAKLRAIRRQKGYSLDELAKQTGFSKSFLSQIENDKNSPSIASLKKITAALDVSIGEMFDSSREGQICFMKKAERTPLVKGGVKLEFASSNIAGRKMEAIFFELQPGGESEGAYTHEGEEFGTVTEGIMCLELDGDEYILEAGDSIYFSSHIPHKWKNVGDGIMKAIWVVTPPSF